MKAAGVTFARSLVEAGVDVLQLRDKRLNDRELLGRARQLRELTRAGGTLFVVNDRADVAALPAPARVTPEPTSTTTAPPPTSGWTPSTASHVPPAGLRGAPVRATSVSSIHRRRKTTGSEHKVQGPPGAGAACTW